MGTETSDVAHEAGDTERIERETWGDAVVVEWSGGGYADDPLDHDLVLRMHVYRGTMELAREHWYVWDCWCVDWAVDCLLGLDAWGQWLRTPETREGWVMVWMGRVGLGGSGMVDVWVEGPGEISVWVISRDATAPAMAGVIASIDALEIAARTLAGVRP